MTMTVVVAVAFAATETVTVTVTAAITKYCYLPRHEHRHPDRFYHCQACGSCSRHTTTNITFSDRIMNIASSITSTLGRFVVEVARSATEDHIGRVFAWC